VLDAHQRSRRHHGHLASRRLVDHPDVPVSVGELDERVVQRGEFGRQRAGRGERAREQADAQRDRGRRGVAENHRAQFRARARGVGFAVLDTRSDELLFDLLLSRFGSLRRLLLRSLAGGRAGGHQEK
jgi:hypothetical protein